MNSESRYKAARDKFFAENPQALTAIESVKPSVIEACGMTVEEYQQQQRYVVFAEAAKSRGLEVDEFVIQLMAQSPEQAQAWRLDRHRQMAEALGIEWAEYKQMNRIIE
ncbi:MULTISPECIES: DUF6388 family protein [Pseudomonas]|uniref:Uncharacterized protein n=1 Tax=Pseudomonas putida TaxID=303 RepID=A0A7V8EJ85_PSEPU|nr:MULTISPECIES: DUF6388 family protein [Pseudomonas]KAF0255654.1 hypothetical protein GN299_06075 [Pseudomonas putida]MBS3183585.1 hypothetical protein [Pseudomonas sp. PCH44]